MKKIILSILSVLALICVFTFAGCDLECEHEAGEWIVDSNATCIADGSKHQICSICGDTVNTEAIAATGHKKGNWITEKKSTCTEDAIMHQICSKCNETLDTKTITADGHTEGEWIVDIEPTCTTEGSKHQICSVCNETLKSESITALGHTDGEWIVDIEPTCTTEGSKHQTCSACGEDTKPEVIPTAAHDYEETVTKATAESKATVKFDCNVCKESHTEDVEPISVSAQLTGSGMTMTGGGMYYTRSFAVTATGGYGEYMYKFESGSNLLQDFSTSNETEIYGNVFVDAAIIKITVMDEAGQKTVYEIKGNGSFVDSYVIYE